MRKLIASTLTTLDGVSQDPGGFGETDFGGWAIKHFDQEAAAASLAELNRYELFLAGRGTFETLYKAWNADTGPYPEAIHAIAKRVVTNSLRDPLPWNATVLPGDPVESVAELKASPGGDVIMYGSGRLFRTLMINNLIDEYKVTIFPVVLGSGNRLFTEELPRTGFELSDVHRFDSGLVGLSYRPAGDHAGVTS